MNTLPKQCSQCKSLNLPTAAICSQCKKPFASPTNKIISGIIALAALVFIPVLCCNFLQNKGKQASTNQIAPTPARMISNASNVNALPLPDYTPPKKAKNKSTAKTATPPLPSPRTDSATESSTYSPPSSSPSIASPSRSDGYFTGPRGGCYTYSGSGRKRYVDHSFCN
jgi:hypothetical protein